MTSLERESDIVELASLLLNHGQDSDEKRPNFGRAERAQQLYFSLISSGYDIELFLEDINSARVWMHISPLRGMQLAHQFQNLSYLARYRPVVAY